MDPNLAALQATIEAASPGTPSLTCLRIADAVDVVLREARAEAWDEGAGAVAADLWADDRGPRNPYRD